LKTNNINFANQIYEEAKILDRYESASRLTEDLKLQHKKYDILRGMLLINSIKIKKECNSNYYDIIYFYKYNSEDLDLKAKQKVFSRILEQVKETKGSEALLIPIAADNDISSINLLLDKYNIKQEQLPTILINNKIKITEIQTVDDVLNYLN